MRLAWAFNYTVEDEIHEGMDALQDVLTSKMCVYVCTYVCMREFGDVYVRMKYMREWMLCKMC